MLPRRSCLPFFLDLIARIIARLLYKVRTSGSENIPAQGGVLLIANHLSYADVVVLQLGCPRPIYFVGYDGLKHNAFFEWVFFHQRLHRDFFGSTACGYQGGRGCAQSWRGCVRVP